MALSRGAVGLGGILNRANATHGLIASRYVARTPGVAAALHGADSTARGFARVTDISRAPQNSIVRHAHSSSARDGVNMGLKGMAPTSRGEYVVTKLDDRS